MKYKTCSRIIHIVVLQYITKLIIYYCVLKSNLIRYCSKKCVWRRINKKVCRFFRFVKANQQTKKGVDL